MHNEWRLSGKLEVSSVPFAVIDGKLSRRPLDVKEQPLRPELHRAAALPDL
jgi:hypothetical protein